MIKKGFKFGIVLQLAIGPVCLFILHTAIVENFTSAIFAVLGAILADTIGILLAAIGLGTIISKNLFIKKSLNIFSALILLLFGIDIITNAFEINIPSPIEYSIGKKNSFIHAFFITIVNPITIVFWTGIFSAKIAEENFSKYDLKLFALGCILSGFAFLSLIALIGSLSQKTIPVELILYLNIFVGLFLFVYGIKLLYKYKTLG